MSFGISPDRIQFLALCLLILMEDFFLDTARGPSLSDDMVVGKTIVGTVKPSTTVISTVRERVSHTSSCLDAQYTTGFG